MSARRTRGGDLKDSKGEEGGEEAVAMAEAEGASESEVKAGRETDKRAADVTLNTESNSRSKKQRISTKQASIQFLDSAATKAAVYKSAYTSAISSMARTNKSNYITEENFNLLHWLYRIRRASCARGLLIGFLQPDFLWSIYRPMMRSKKLWRTDSDIKVAADLWCYNRAKALKRYGHISDWDVSSVTNMRELFHGQGDEYAMEKRFRGKDLFNDDISRWDVSNVTNMNGMFFCARAFNQAIGDWDVSKVTCMRCMFNGANEFNQAVGSWNMSNITDIAAMFSHAQSFNQPVGDWDVSRVTHMSSMFWNAYAFNQPIGDWDVSKVSDTDQMFWNAHAFNQPIGDWDVSKVTYMQDMFKDAEAFNQDLTRWDMRSVRYRYNMFRGADVMQRDNKPATVRDDVNEHSDYSDDEGEWEEAGTGV